MEQKLVENEINMFNVDDKFDDGELKQEYRNKFQLIFKLLIERDYTSLAQFRLINLSEPVDNIFTRKNVLKILEVFPEFSKLMNLKDGRDIAFSVLSTSYPYNEDAQKWVEAYDNMVHAEEMDRKLDSELNKDLFNDDQGKFVVKPVYNHRLDLIIRLAIFEYAQNDTIEGEPWTHDVLDEVKNFPRKNLPSRRFTQSQFKKLFKVVPNLQDLLVSDKSENVIISDWLYKYVLIYNDNKVANVVILAKFLKRYPVYSDLFKNYSVDVDKIFANVENSITDAINQLSNDIGTNVNLIIKLGKIWNKL